MTAPTCSCGAPLVTVPCLWCAAFPGETCAVCQGRGGVVVCSVSQQPPRHCTRPDEPPQMTLFEVAG